MRAAALALGLLAALGGGMFWANRRLVAITVAGPSMEPSYRSGDRVLVHRGDATKVRRGDVIVLQNPSLRRGAPGGPNWVIKRAAAVAGDADPLRPAADPAPVPAGWLAVLGDNSALSTDSRTYGLVPADLVLGRVVRRLAERQQ